MRLHKDEQKLLEIRQIQDIESIELKDIFQSNINGKRHVVPGFMVVYGEPLKIIYLTTQDKYFEDYVKRIRQVYLEEKDLVISEGIMGKKYLTIDPISKELLLNGTLESYPTHDVYKDKEGYDESLLFEEDRLMAQWPMIEHHLKETLAKLGITMSDVQLSEGNNGIYYVTTIIDGTPKILPLEYLEDDNVLRIKIGNVTENVIPLEMKVIYTNNGINIICSIEEYQYSDYTSYLNTSGAPIKEREIVHNGRLVHWAKDALGEIDGTIPNTWANLELDRQMKWYSIPGNGYFGVHEDDKCLEEDGTLSDGDGNNRMLTGDMSIIYASNNNVFMKNVAQKSYYKKADDHSISEHVLLDKIDETVYGTILDDAIVLERGFNKNGPNGFYKKHLAGKYFYQVYDKELKNRTFLDKKSGLQEPCDLLDEKVIKKGRI